MASPGNRHCANCIGTLSFPKAQNDRLSQTDRATRYTSRNLVNYSCAIVTVETCCTANPQQIEYGIVVGYI